MLNELVKFGLMSPLQEQTTRLGICSYCHKKTLELRLRHEEGDWLQCSKCLTVFCRDSVQTTKSP